jgi:TIGR03009 family protein
MRKTLPLGTIGGAVLLCLAASPADAQQPLQQPVPQPASQQQLAPQQAPLQQVQQPPTAAQPPAGFNLNALQQAELDQLLDAWQTKSTAIKTFSCSFERWEYNLAFGPANQNIPLNKNKGELSYQRPDKGSFQIIQIRTFQAQQAPAAQPQPAQVTGTWIENADAIGEHWVCDGKAVYEYRHDQKQLVERPIPPNRQGQAIVDNGPLPFLFGADSAKLKQRYWMRVEPGRTSNEVMLHALPRFQEQAADFRRVDVIFDRTQLLPTHMQVQMPDGNRHVYIFDLANASVNSPLARLQQLFQRPRVPFGYKHVVENVPLAEAPQPDQQQPR